MCSSRGYTRSQMPFWVVLPPPQWGLAGHSPVKLSGHSPDALLPWVYPFTDAILGCTALHLNLEWWSRLGWQAKTPYGWAGLTPAERLPVKGGGLYIGSPDKGCHQGASSPCEFPTITVPGHPSPRRETGDQCFFLLSLQNLQTLPTAVAGRKECSGGEHVPTPNPMTMLDGPRNLYFQARTSWD